MVDGLDLISHDVLAGNIAHLAERFPTVVTVARSPDGSLVEVVDWDALRQEFADRVLEGPHERYQLDWPGKRAAAFAANAPIAKTLRPLRDESVDFDTTKNLFVEGDNLDALKLLQESYLGKVNVIYIDPPYNTGNDLVQYTLTEAISSVKPDRTDEDLLFQELLDWGLDLAESITVEKVGARRVLSVAGSALMACFADEVTDHVVKEIASRRPLRAVFLDAGFASDAARSNAEQVFREVPPATDVKAI